MITIEKNGKPLKVWTNDPNTLIEQNTLDQAALLLELPFIYKHIALMPDAHVGIGATIGSVIATDGAIIPSAVGVDIGCGMSLTPLVVPEPHYFAKNPEKITELYDQIRRSVKSGFPCQWHKIPQFVQDIWDVYLKPGFDEMRAKHPKLPGRSDVNQLGTLGGGNHFIEIAVDERGNYFLVLHSGSRGIGNKIGVYFIRRAKDLCKARGETLPHFDLAYLTEGTEDFDDYLRYVAWAQAYAKKSRFIMRHLILDQIRRLVGMEQHQAESGIDIHHNFVAREEHFGKDVWVTRKGAVRADLESTVIIPGSMGARTYVADGLGNPESFMSCSHGAGRTMGRRQAKREIGAEAHAAALSGIVCDSSATTLDESPMAYKNIDDVMTAQADLVQPVLTVKQILCVKGQDDR